MIMVMIIRSVDLGYTVMIHVTHGNCVLRYLNQNSQKKVTTVLSVSHAQLGHIFQCQFLHFHCNCFPTGDWLVPRIIVQSQTQSKK